MRLFEVSEKEIKRSQVLQAVIQGSLTRTQASQRLGITLRQVDRLKKRFVKNGIVGLIHHSRGRSSGRGMRKEKGDEIIRIVGEFYHDFGPTLASEKLFERHKIKVSREKLRQLMMNAGLWKGKERKTSKAYQRRRRRSRRGELLQGDASPHAWFEDRGEKCDLVSFIDDATGHITARFEPSETKEGYMRLLRSYIEKHGCPEALYVDKNSIFRVNNRKNNSKSSQTTFGRIVKELGIELICAHSPQAKGRVERMYNTFQDRVLKEMRLANVCSIEEGNRFLEEYLPIYNARFSKEAASLEDGHHRVFDHLDLDRVFTLREERTISKSLDVSIGGQIYQILNCSTPRRLMNKKATIFFDLDRTLWLECQSKRYELVLYRETEAELPEMDRKQLDNWLNRKGSMTVKERLVRGIAIPA